jgi:hypothetical protein
MISIFAVLLVTAEIRRQNFLVMMKRAWVIVVVVLVIYLTALVFGFEYIGSSLSLEYSWYDIKVILIHFKNI